MRSCEYSTGICRRASLIIFSIDVCISAIIVLTLSFDICGFVTVVVLHVHFDIVAVLFCLFCCGMIGVVFRLLRALTD